MGAREHGPFFPRGMRQAALTVLAIVILIFPMVCALPSGDGAAVSASPAVSGSSSTASVTSPPAAITVQPTQLSVRQNRTTLVQIAKNVADRQKVTILAFWFFIIVTIAVCGLLAILYLLIRKGAGAFPRRNVPPPAFASGRETVIEPHCHGHDAVQEIRSADGPAVEFPPFLKKRFRNPVFIGEGGLARVFRAENVKNGMTIAVKVPVRFDEVTGTHFTRDIVFWQGLYHENIIRIYSSNILPVPYIEMEYAPSSLAAISLPIPEVHAVSLTMGIARGLAFAHKKGIVHRDIKPENILLSDAGIPKITDWGLGKAIGDVRQSTMIGFSPAYAAPEQIAPHRFGRPGPATDIYQLGMVLCELLTGRPAFSAEGIHDLNMAILEDHPAIPSWGGRNEPILGAILGRCLAKRPEDRYQSVDDLIRDLERIQRS